MAFENGATAIMTMTAFTRHAGRKTRIFGTCGEIDTDSATIKIFNFLTDKERIVDTNVANDGGIASGHGGGDFGLMESFTDAVSSGDQSKILSGIDETLASHLMVFSAEESRRKNQIIDL